MSVFTWVKVSTFLSSAGEAPLNYIPIPALPVDSADAPFIEAAKTYATITEMLDDGFLATSQVVLAAGEVFGQTTFTNTPPTRLVVIKRAAPVAQVEEYTPLETADGDYKLFISTVGGTAVEAATFAAVGQTDAQIKDALETAFNLGPFAATHTAATVDANTGNITADVPGVPFVLTATGPVLGAADFDVSNATPNVGIYEDLDTAFAVEKFWEVIPNPAEPDGVKIEAGRWAEASKLAGSPRRNVCTPQTSDSDIETATEPNFASENVALGRTRTFPLYHQNLTDQMSAAWFGRYGGQFAGSKAWHFGQLGGTGLTNSINYDQGLEAILTAARVSWVVRDGPSATAPLRVVWGQGSGGFFHTTKQAEDAWWLLVGQAIAVVLEQGITLDDAGIATLILAVNEVNILFGTNDPPVLDLDRTTVTAVAPADVPPAQLQVGDYTPPGGGITVTSVIGPKGRTIDVSATFGLA